MNSNYKSEQLFYYFFAFFDGELHAGSGEGSGDNSGDDQVWQVPEDPRCGGYDHRDADLGCVVDHRADNAYRPEVLFKGRFYQKTFRRKTEQPACHAVSEGHDLAREHAAQKHADHQDYNSVTTFARPSLIPGMAERGGICASSTNMVRAIAVSTPINVIRLTLNFIFYLPVTASISPPSPLTIRTVSLWGRQTIG